MLLLLSLEYFTRIIAAYFSLCFQIQEKNDQYYKNKFHVVVQKLKQMQEQFCEAHQTTRKNITGMSVEILFYGTQSW